MDDYEKALAKVKADLKTKMAGLSGLQLDICCGEHKQAGYFGIDIQPLAGVDLVWDVLQIPWPLPSECAVRAVASHVIEHIPKVALDQGHTRWPLLEFMNEVWRLLKVDGEFAISAPHGLSQGYRQDPTHASPIDEAMWAYFDPDHYFYTFYRPRPWRRKFLNFSPAGNIEVVLVKLNPPQEK